MARTLLLRMASGVGNPAAELIDRTTRIVAETVTLTEGDGTSGNPKRDYTGTIDVGTAAGTYDINLKSGSSYIGGDNVIIGATDARYDADSVKPDLSGTTVGGISGGGSGARTVTVTVQTSGAVAIQGATVRMTKGAESFVQTTGALGTAAFNLNDGTWTVSITAVGYAFAGTTLVVDGTEAPTYTMTTNSPSSPGAPNLSTGYVYCYSTDGLPEEGAEIIAYQTQGPGTAAYAYDAAEFTITSGADGLAEHTGFVRGGIYKVRRGTGREITVTVPAAASFQLPEILGAP